MVSAGEFVKTDLNILIILLIFPLILLFLPFLARRGRRALAIFPFLGGIIGVYGWAGLGVDGSVTQVSGGSSVVLLSGSTTGSAGFLWEALLVTWLVLFLANFIFAAYTGLIE